MGTVAEGFLHATSTSIAVTTVASPLGTLLVAAAGDGVCAVTFDDRAESLEPKLRRTFGHFFRLHDGDPLGVAERLLSYFSGDRTALEAVPSQVRQCRARMGYGARATAGRADDLRGARRTPRHAAGATCGRRVPCLEPGAIVHSVPPGRGRIRRTGKPSRGHSPQALVVEPRRSPCHRRAGRGALRAPPACATRAQPRGSRRLGLLAFVR
jgi:hypothetical protein